MKHARSLTVLSLVVFTTKMQRSQDTLYSLGADTGGRALLDYNDLSAGIVQVQKAFSSYYIIGYYSQNETVDGKFRRIKIALNGSLSASLNYRQGYFDGKEFGKFTAADKERQFEEALMLGDPIDRSGELCYERSWRSLAYNPEIGAWARNRLSEGSSKSSARRWRRWSSK